MAKQELLATTRTASRVVRQVIENARQEFISRGAIKTSSPVIAAEIINLCIEKQWAMMIGYGSRESDELYQISRYTTR
jgi:hypothetical protein